MLPVISTRPLSNFELTLSPDGTRVGNHRCSNLLDFNEIQTGHGFITDATKNPEIIGETSPYQYSTEMRSTNSLRFYRNLNLEACLWEFNSYYDMSELLTTCGGSIGTDGQVLERERHTHICTDANTHTHTLTRWLFSVCNSRLLSLLSLFFSVICQVESRHFEIPSVLNSLGVKFPLC